MKLIGRTQMNPVTTSGAIIGVKYDGGVLLASDVSVGYGSLFKFSDVSHFSILTNEIVIGATGEYADFQEMIDIVSAVILEEQCKHDGMSPTPSEVHTFVKRIMYQRRTKMNPVVAKIVIAGANPDGSFYLGCSDPYGITFEDKIITTGIAGHLKGLSLDRVVGKQKDIVYDALIESFRVLFSRDSGTNGPVEIVDVNATGIVRHEPVLVEPRWDMVSDVYQLS